MKTIVVCRMAEVPSGKYCVEDGRKCQCLATMTQRVQGMVRIVYRCQFFNLTLGGHDPEIEKCDSCRHARRSSVRSG